MKKALLSLLILALVMIPVLVSCEDTSQLEKIGKLMSDFSGVGKVTPEQAKKQTEQAASQIEEKFKGENLEKLDFKEISDMFYDFPAADLKKETNIGKRKLYDQVEKSIKERATQISIMENASDLISGLSLTGDFEIVAEGLASKISCISAVFQNIITESTGGQATLKDVKQASAVASMCGALAGIVNEVIEEFGIEFKEEGPQITNPKPSIETMIPVLLSSMNNYNNAAKAYAEATDKKASDFTIDLASLAGQFFGSEGGIK